jgi:hypothetical protein
MPPQRSPNTVARRIHFYRAIVPKIKSQPGAFDPQGALKRIDSLAFNVEGKYMQDGDRLLCCWVEKAANPARARLAVVRREGLPSVEEQGVETDLTLNATAGLVEQIHIRCFDHKIVGCDFNFYGPRLPSFGRYLAEKGGSKAPKVEFEPLVRQDIAEMLAGFAGVRAMTLRVRRSELDAIEQSDKNLGAALRAQAKLGAAEEVEMTLRVKPYSRGITLSASLFNRAKKLAARKDIAEIAGRFIVDAVPEGGGSSRTLNILDDHLISEQQIAKRPGRGRGLDHASAYDAIGRAYGELKDDLIRAASISSAE